MTCGFMLVIASKADAAFNNIIAFFRTRLNKLSLDDKYGLEEEVMSE
ncbi:hypothetical protein [Cytobacillus praedii]